MRSWIERATLALVLVLGAWSLPQRVSAQAGEVMADDAAGGEDATDEPGAGRLSPSDGLGDPEDEDSDEGDDGAEEDARSLSDEVEPRPVPYQVGLNLPIEVGGHLMVSFFTLPSLPELEPGLGFQGRIATRLWGDIVGEGNVAIMFNPDRGGEATFKTAMLRLGARYPIDLRADPVLFFVGAGAALDVFWVSQTDVSTNPPRELSKSALSPAFDLNIGLMYAVHDRIAIELMAQGTYAFANVVFSDNAASWFTLLGGVSYDL